MSNRIKLESLVKQLDLNVNSLALVLFPDNKHPIPSLKRVLSGKALLDERQVYMLSEIAGISIEELYSPESWKAKRKGKNMYFSKGRFCAILDTESMTTSLYEGTEFIDKLVHAPSEGVMKYLNTIDLFLTNRRNAR